MTNRKIDLFPCKRKTTSVSCGKSPKWRPATAVLAATLLLIALLATVDGDESANADESENEALGGTIETHSPTLASGAIKKTITPRARGGGGPLRRRFVNGPPGGSRRFGGNDVAEEEQTRSPAETPLTGGPGFLRPRRMSARHLLASHRSGNFCPFAVTKTVTCLVANGTETYQSRVAVGAGSQSMTMTRPHLVTLYKEVKETNYGCCPGFYGDNCDTSYPGVPGAGSSVAGASLGGDNVRAAMENLFNALSTNLDFLDARVTILENELTKIRGYPGVPGAGSSVAVGTSSGRYTSAAASSDGTPCAQIAVNTLEAGGTAADATIAGMFCSGVVNPHSMGVGGGFLLTYYSRGEGRAYTLNAREVAPSAATRDMFQGDPNLSEEGALSVAVPGEVRGYMALYERFGGGVPWADLLAPAITLCEEGHPVNFHLANALNSKREKIIAEPTLSAFVSNATGDVLQEGDIFFLPDLALTLRTLQQEPDALYTGELAAKIIQDLDDLGGIITLADLANYTAEWDDPIQVLLQSVPSATLYTVPAPGSGPVLAFMLNVLDEYAFDTLSLSPEEEVLTHQRITETFKYAYALRTRIGDPKFEDVEELVANMTSEEYARSIREMILEATTSQDPEYYGAYTEGAEDHGTSHFSVIAANGDSVAATSTVNSYLGAMISSTQTGVIYNNEMDDFSSPNITNQFDIPPSPVNYIKPGKRPMSSMCPSVVVDTLTGAPRLVVGGAGGSKITSAVALVAAHNLWFGTPLADAVTLRRIHHQLYPMVLSYEEQFSQTIVAGLEAKNHTAEEYSTVGSSVVGAVSLEQDGYIYAAADFRKNGEVDGY